MPEKGLDKRGSARDRWYASALSLRSKAQQRINRNEEALEDGLHAVRFCRWLPEAWEALADAALAAGDKRTAALALSELLYLQPPKAPSLPLELANKRRTQYFMLDSIRRGTDGLGGSLLAATAYAMSSKPPPRRGAASTPSEGEQQQQQAAPTEETREEMAQARAIFADDYVVSDTVDVSE